MHKTVQKLVSQKCFTWLHSGSLVSLVFWGVWAIRDFILCSPYVPHVEIVIEPHTIRYPRCIAQEQRLNQEGTLRLARQVTGGSAGRHVFIWWSKDFPWKTANEKKKLMQKKTLEICFFIEWRTFELPGKQWNCNVMIIYGVGRWFSYFIWPSIWVPCYI